MNFKNSSIDDIDLVFFDVETTGLYPEEGDALCEIGGIKVRGGQSIDTFQTLINPKQSIPAQAQAIHKISDDDVKGAPYFEEAVDKFLYFLGNSIMCGYNVGFDLGFLNYELKKINYPAVDLPSLDILVMARRTVEGLGRYNLRSLAAYFQLTTTHFHRALDDARATKEIFYKIKDILQEQRITKVQDFITLYGFSNDFFKRNQEPKIALIKEGIHAKLSLQIRYVSSRNTLRTFVVIPKELLEDKKATYLLGANPKTNDTLTFNLTSILGVEII